MASASERRRRVGRASLQTGIGRMRLRCRLRHTLDRTKVGVEEARLLLLQLPLPTREQYGGLWVGGSRSLSTRPHALAGSSARRLTDGVQLLAVTTTELLPAVMLHCTTGIQFGWASSLAVATAGYAAFRTGSLAESENAAQE